MESGQEDNFSRVNNSFSASHVALVLTKLKSSTYVSVFVKIKKKTCEKLPMALGLFEPVFEQRTGWLTGIKCPDF